MKRLFDITAAVIASILLSPVFLLLALIVKTTSKGPVIHISDRVGINNRIFRMYKFRTMRTDTPDVATHILEDPDLYLTSVGRFLRKTSLDEIPQLYNIIRGDMSFVGPRPALHNQDDLIKLRTERNIHTVTPGLTGWAQINGRDNIVIDAKVDLDDYYSKNRSLAMDIKIISKTVTSAIKGSDVTH